MRGIVPILASVVMALGLGAGLLALERYGPAAGASLGAAIAVAAIAAFLLAYDVLKRGELGAEHPGRTGETGGGKAPVRPMFDLEAVVVIDAVPRNGIEHMNEALKERRRDVVYVFRIRLKPRNRYEHQALTEQLAVLVQQIGAKTFVYFVRADDGFVCLGEAEGVLNLLKNASGVGLLDLVNSGLDDTLKETYKDELVSFTLPRKITSADALGRMALANAPLAMIVHERGTPIGPIDWATLTTRVLRSKS
jgi:hypothetical protein